MRALHVFIDADLRMGHVGLVETAKKAGVRLSGLSKGEALLFVNTSKNKVKALCPGGVVSYLKLEDRSQLSVHSLDAIPGASDPNLKMTFNSQTKRKLAELLGFGKTQQRKIA